jgi:hypothetical protein
VALRLASFVDAFKGGAMDQSRRLEGLSRLLRLEDDIRRATTQDLSAALRVLRMKLSTTDREAVLQILAQERRKLIELVGAVDNDDDHTEEDEDHQQQDEDQADEAQSQGDEQPDQEEEKGDRHDSQPLRGSRPTSHPSLSLTSSHRASSRLHRSSSGSGGLVEYGAGVSDQEFQLVQMMVAAPSVVSLTAKASLSHAGRKLLRQMSGQPSASSRSASSSSSSTALPRSAAPPPQRRRRGDDIPIVSYRLPSPGRKAAATVHKRQVRPLPIDDYSDTSLPGDDGSDGEVEEVDASGPLTDVIERDSVVAHLIGMGVDPSLAKDNIGAQVASLVYPNSHTSWWSSRRDTITDIRVFYEGQVLSMLLDHLPQDAAPLAHEIAARRWFTLLQVANNLGWSEAQAFLPLSASSGMTAKQLLLVRRFGKAMSASSRQPSKSKNSYRSGSGAAKSGTAYSSSQKRKRDGSDSRKKKQGAAPNTEKAEAEGARTKKD